MAQYHLVQLNVARALAPMESATMRGFVERLAEINTLAEQSDGFIWRLKDDAGDATSIRAFDDPDMLINMSVWRDLQSLRAFVYRSSHLELVRKRAQWFESPAEVYQALWWSPAGELPTLPQARKKLNLIQGRGPTEQAFDFAHPYEAPGQHQKEA